MVGHLLSHLLGHTHLSIVGSSSTTCRLVSRDHCHGTVSLLIPDCCLFVAATLPLIITRRISLLINYIMLRYFRDPSPASAPNNNLTRADNLPIRLRIMKVLIIRIQLYPHPAWGRACPSSVPWAHGRILSATYSIEVDGRLGWI